MREEIGLTSFIVHSWHAESGVPLDIDTHAIPANVTGGEGLHPHHGFRYLFEVEKPDLSLKNDPASTTTCMAPLMHPGWMSNRFRKKHPFQVYTGYEILRMSHVEYKGTFKLLIA